MIPDLPWSIVVPQLFTLLAVGATFIANLRLYRHKIQAEVFRERRRRQLNDFYGPLVLLLGRSETCHQFFSDALIRGDHTTADAIIKHALTPLNEQIRELILTHSELIDAKDTLLGYSTFLTHADAFNLRFTVGVPNAGVPHLRFPLGLQQAARSMYELARYEYLREVAK